MTIKRSIFIVAFAAMIFGFTTEAFSQYEAQVIKDLRNAVTQANSTKRLDEIKATAASSRLEAASKCLKDTASVMKAVNDVNDRLLARYNKKLTDTLAPSIFSEIQTTLPLNEMAIVVPERCGSLIYATDKEEIAIKFRDSFRSANRTLKGLTASIFSFSASIRSIDISLAQADAVKAGQKFDITQHLPTYRLMIADMTKAISYDPKRKSYEKRARYYKEMGETAKAAADLAEAAKYPAEVKTDVTQK